MLIEKPGNPDMAWANPRDAEYRFECPRCGCVFREGGRDCWHVSEAGVKNLCLNCKNVVDGKKIKQGSGF